MIRVPLGILLIRELSDEGWPILSDQQETGMLRACSRVHGISWVYTQPIRGVKSGDRIDNDTRTVLFSMGDRQVWDVSFGESPVPQRQSHWLIIPSGLKALSTELIATWAFARSLCPVQLLLKPFHSA